ncbi:hypothetical protein [Paenarthrobacter nitroguajacolicus]|nr:hypothetical protein [Paenarthrobacter nitroguajacolicus]
MPSLLLGVESHRRRILGAMAIWCLTSGRGRFVGNWSWSQWGVSVWVECV